MPALGVKGSYNFDSFVFRGLGGCGLETLAKAWNKTGWRIYAYVLIGNH
jgi:hypothetical protein